MTNVNEDMSIKITGKNFLTSNIGDYTGDLSDASYIQPGLIHLYDGINNDGSGTQNTAATNWKCNM